VSIEGGDSGLPGVYFLREASERANGSERRAGKWGVVDRIDFGDFGNSKPFRIRVTNLFNDNSDYFYVKQADASRIYGLELDHILSPNRISLLVSQLFHLPRWPPMWMGFVAIDFFHLPRRSAMRMSGWHVIITA
jgi:hypothetical protein